MVSYPLLVRIFEHCVLERRAWGTGCGPDGEADQMVRLRYQNTRMYRIIPGFMCQGGDFNFGNGGMGESIYGQFMRNERFAFSHSKRGVLSMADAGWEHSNNSNFFITFGPQKHLDSRHVAFGAIEHGMEVLDAIEKVGTIGGKPKRPVIIHKSGELNVDLLRREAIEANEGLPLGSEEYVERSADSWGNPDPEIDDGDVYCMPERLTVPDQYSPVPDHLFRRAKAQWDNQLGAVMIGYSCAVLLLHQLLPAASHRRCSQTPARLLEEFGEGGFWEYVGRWSTFHVDTAVALNSMREFRSWYSAVSGREEADCRTGSGVLALLSAVAADYDSGKESARKLFEKGRRLIEEGRSEGSAVVWDWGGIDRQLEVMGRLLDLPLEDEYEREARRSEAARNCFGTNLRIFVYEYHSNLPKFDTGRRAPFDKADREYLPLFRDGPPLTCAFGMYASEVYFPRLLKMYPGCLTDDPGRADIFLLPSYFKCLDMLDWLDDFRPRKGSKSVAGMLLEEVMNLAHSEGFLDRRGGVDHVMLWSWGKYPCAVQEESSQWQRYTGSIQNLQVEGVCGGGAKRNFPTGFSPWKDIIIPGYVDLWRIEELRNFNRPLAERSIFVAFHGRHGGIDETYANVSIRTKLIEELSGKADVSIGGFVEEYHEVVGSSIYCVAPRGVTPWTIHFYVAIFAGCIPVLISDDFQLPFPSEIDYSRFVIRWGEEESLEGLYDYLKTISVKNGMKMRAYMESIECWLNYWSEVPGCSPVVGVLRGLRRNVDHMARRWHGL
ncbi:hypothetical protein FOZ63_006932 [Perkinsus olseni]|uniref:PPIase cyclophilin-type domain-containing protein n=1 Tax=Perkinsus olseni TaxID=32597 RepID=A0A7J6U5K0_PEROL|nr:hypothetical protein FOZ63_006932 [Perkinsus olseni]